MLECSRVILNIVTEYKMYYTLYYLNTAYYYLYIFDSSL